MSTIEHEVTLLHKRSNLLEETATLVNREWPRSLAARQASIREGCDELPCSMIMLNRAGAVIGHARLIAVAGVKQGALIESVIVAPEIRGQGLGRKLMEAAEAYLKKIGYTAIHLSTHDKQKFYRHLGYRNSTPVSGRTKVVGKLSEQQTQSLLGEAEVLTTLKLLVKEKPTDPTPLPQTGVPPPPPPPPPRLPENTKTVTITWMVKQLV